MDTGGRVWVRSTMHMSNFPVGVVRLVDPVDPGIQALLESGVIVRTDEHGVDLVQPFPSAGDTENQPKPEPDPPHELNDPGPEPDAIPGAGLHDHQEEPGKGEASVT